MLSLTASSSCRWIVLVASVVAFAAVVYARPDLGPYLAVNQWAAIGAGNALGLVGSLILFVHGRGYAQKELYDRAGTKVGAGPSSVVLVPTKTLVTHSRATTLYDGMCQGSSIEGRPRHETAAASPAVAARGALANFFFGYRCVCGSGVVTL